MRERLHVLLHKDPRVDVSLVGAPQLRGEVLGVHVVHQLGDVLHVEDVKVEKVVVDQLAYHRLTWNVCEKWRKKALEKCKWVD